MSNMPAPTPAEPAAPTTVGTAPANPIGDPMLPDEAVAAAIVDEVPGTHDGDKPTQLGEIVYTAVITAIRRERNRAVSVVREIAIDLARRSQRDHADAQAARLVGNERGAMQMEAGAAANAGISNYLGRFLVLAVGLPPGDCRKCLGQKVVASRLAAGQSVPCPACSVGPQAAPVDGVAG